MATMQAASGPGGSAAGEAGHELRAVERLLRRQRLLRRRDISLAILTPIVLLAFWQISASFHLVDTRIFSPPVQVARAARELVSAGTLQADLGATGFRLVLGYLIGCTAGTAVGLAMGYFRVVGAALSPTLAGLYSIPKIAVLPVLLVIFGLGETPRVLTVAASTFFVQQINTMEGVRYLDPRIIEAGRAFGASGARLFRHVILPGALPAVFTGLRITAPIALVVVIATEFVAANDGLGYLIWNSWTLFQPPKMYVGLVCSALVGAIFTGIVVGASWLALPWTRRSKPAGGGRWGRSGKAA